MDGDKCGGLDRVDDVHMPRVLGARKDLRFFHRKSTQVDGQRRFSFNGT